MILAKNGLTLLRSFGQIRLQCFATAETVNTTKTPKPAATPKTKTSTAQKSTKMVRKILCVAEKNDAAKSISRILSSGNSTIRNGASVYNKLYCFSANMLGQQSNIVFTSVSGHLMNLEFPANMKNWSGVPISTCFTAEVHRTVPQNMKKLESQLITEARGAEILIIFTDCDREGENIGAEVVEVCTKSNSRLRVFRARFSEITPNSIRNAFQSLQPIDSRMVEAVNCRTELDLRIGAAFTRLQTLFIRQNCPQALTQAENADKIVSYGSCQFPTLGFVVERYLQHIEFQPEQFWKLAGRDEGKKVDFVWSRDRLFDERAVKVYLDLCSGTETASVTAITKKPKSRWRPAALDTVELEKLGVRKLRLTAKRTLAAAEKLYTQGFISYPRTETNIFPKDINLNELVAKQNANPQWGAFAADIATRGGANARNGNKSDAAHPPIHPLKAAGPSELNGDELKVYELVVRHFLACCSRDAKGQETHIEVKINGEAFFTTGLIIEDLGFLEVYVYDKWTNKSLPPYAENEVIPKFGVKIQSGHTTAPPLLTEADLIALMDKHGIGTDATHAEHIEKIKQRNYVQLNEQSRFVPTIVGMSLVDAYNRMGQEEVGRPRLRADLEKSLVDICNGQKTKHEVLNQQIQLYRNIYDNVERNIALLSDSIRAYSNQN